MRDVGRATGRGRRGPVSSLPVRRDRLSSRATPLPEGDVFRAHFYALYC